jgi:hypothetical protein
MALGSIEPLTERVLGIFLGVKGGWRVRLTNFQLVNSKVVVVKTTPHIEEEAHTPGANRSQNRKRQGTGGKLPRRHPDVFTRMTTQ